MHPVSAKLAAFDPTRERLVRRESLARRRRFRLAPHLAVSHLEYTASIDAISGGSDLHAHRLVIFGRTLTAQVFCSQAGGRIRLRNFGSRRGATVTQRLFEAGDVRGRIRGMSQATSSHRLGAILR